MRAAAAPQLAPGVLWRGLPVEDFKLANGLRVILQPDRRLPLVALHLGYRAGSRRDPEGRCGLAHLCEHLAALDPAKGVNRVIERIGGMANGVTLHDRTGFTSVLPSAHLGLVLRVEARRMAGLPVPPSETLEVQRRVLLQERLQTVENRPYGRSFEVLHRLLYPPEHPYHRPPAGLPEDILAITSTDVETHVRTCYCPAEAVLVLAGDLSCGKAARWIGRFFGHLPAWHSEAGPRAMDSPPLPPSRGERREVLADTVPAARAFVAFRGPAAGDGDWAVAALWARCAAIGRFSPLRHRLVDTGIAQDVQTHLLPLRDASTLALSATAAPGVDPGRLTDALVAAVDDLTASGVPGVVLDRARRKALTDHYSVVQRLKPRADHLAMLATEQIVPLRLDGEEERFGAVSSEELRVWAAGSCRPERRVVLSVVPEERP